ncbi:MAG: hypothetical protein ACPG05_05520 [Bdellovibrionales bacterium]
MSADDRDWLRKFSQEWSEDQQRDFNQFSMKMGIYGVPEAQKVTKEAYISYAQMILKNLIIINGGGLASLPIAKQLGMTDSVLTFMAGGLVFGLVFAVFAMFSAFFSIKFGSYALDSDIQYRFCQHMKGAHSLREEKALENFYKGQLKGDDGGKSNYDKSDFFEVVAIIFSILSIASFTIGIVLPLS